MAEHKKYQKAGIVIIIGAILVLIMRLYILSAILFLIGLIAATYPFIKKNTNEVGGVEIEESKCNCENCDSNGCDKNCDNIDCPNIDCEVISTISDGENITNISNESGDAEIPQDPDVKSEIESDIKANEDKIELYSDTQSEVDVESDISIESEIGAQPDVNPVIEVDFENGTKSTTDASSLDDEDNSEIDTIINDNEKDD